MNAVIWILVITVAFFMAYDATTEELCCWTF